MGMDASKFAAIKDRARKMIHDDAKQDSHIIKERQMDREKTYRSLKSSGAAISTGFDNLAPSYGSNGTSIGALNEAYSDDNNALYDAMDNKMKQFMESRNLGQSQAVTKAPTQVNKSLPKEILESFSTNYIDQSAFDLNRSVLDSMGITNNEQSVVEQRATQQVQTPVSNSKIDYELIKSIVESSVKKYIGALSKKMLTENNELAMIQVGDKKINLVTKNGNVYEAALIKKYNIKEINQKN